MGIRWHTVHFEQTPSITATKKGLLGLTGLALIFDEEFDNCLGVQHPNRIKSRIELDWVDRESHQCIHIDSETLNWNYIEISALYLLKQLEGKLEKEHEFTSWAGKKWADAFPRNPFLRLKAWWNGTLPQ